MAEQPYKIKTKDERALFIHVRNIVVTDRARKEYTQMEPLKESIHRHGLLQPVIVTSLPKLNGDEETKYRLLAGGRRYRCCLMLGAVEIPCIDWKNTTELERSEIEFDENECRAPVTWPERAALYARIDAIKKAQKGDAETMGVRDPARKEAWSETKTAELVGEDRSNVSKLIRIHDKMEADPEFKEKAKGKPWTTVHKIMVQEEQAKTLQAKVDKGEVKLATNIILGDSRLLIKGVPDASVDMLLWDPPFGQLGITEREGKASTSAVQAYLQTLKATDNMSLESATALVKDLVPELFRVMKPAAYFVIFHCSELYQPLVDILRGAGFELDPCPVIWDKGKATAPGRGYSYMPSYEPILIGVKPPWERRMLKDTRNILSFTPVPNNARKHAFQKPPELLDHLIKQMTDPGMTILDPTCGSGAHIYAAEDAKRSAIGFEVDPQNYAQSMVWGQERKGNGTSSVG